MKKVAKPTTPTKARKAAQPRPEQPIKLPKANQNAIIKKGLYW